jgi:hypothetical protein
MANDESKTVKQETVDFLMLPIVSNVNRGMMPKFMNGITWQAAWLWHRFKWVQAVVGYALTEVPEKVLEIYAIPENNLQQAQAQLDQLKAQPEYQTEVKACLKTSPDDKTVPWFHAQSYKTSLSDSILKLQQQISVIQKDERNVADRQVAYDNWLKASQAATPETDVFLKSELALAKKTLQQHQDELEKEHRAVHEHIPPYFLAATIKVNKPSTTGDDPLGNYNREMSDLIRNIKRWECIAAGHANEDSYDLMHIWKFGSADDLYRQMVELRENEVFSDLERYITEESQTLMCNWEAVAHSIDNQMGPG